MLPMVYLSFSVLPPEQPLAVPTQNVEIGNTVGRSHHKTHNAHEGQSTSPFNL